MIQKITKNLIMVCGIPGSGKSTWIKEEIAKQSHFSIAISRDQVRFSMVAEDEEYFSKEKEVFKEFIRQIKTALHDNLVENVFVDATNLNPHSRTKVLRALGKDIKDINMYAVAFVIPTEIALERNSHRTGREFVPEQAILNMKSSYEFPSFEEGFKEIYLIDSENNMTVRC